MAFGLAMKMCLLLHFKTILTLHPKGCKIPRLNLPLPSWHVSNGSPMALLMYDDIRNEADPIQLMLDLLESTYSAGAKLAEWTMEELNVPALAEL